MSSILDAKQILKEYNWGFSVLITVTVNCIFVQIIFGIVLYFVLSIQRAILKLEEEQNSKFKTMFNAIEDAVIVVQGDKNLKFMNYYAKELIGQYNEPID